jgi:anhydro-N-acetylmuramic acid kinase
VTATLYIGLISGTSRDGVDAALVNIEDQKTDLLHAFCKPYPAALRTDIDSMVAKGERPEKGKTLHLDEQLGRFFARTANELLEQAGVEKRDVHAIGSHGQTVWHDPDNPRPVSIQLGDGSAIARSTGITTVSDFRKADLRAGGQGAPLAPLLHKELFHSADERRAVLNIGGIANITWLETDGNVSGFDSGPGNCLMDAWIEKCQGEAFDRGGSWAASGTIRKDLLEALLADDYFSKAPPKSTGIETFNLPWLWQKLEGFEADSEDIQCTLAELSVRTIVKELESGKPPGRVLVCGGGVHNNYLMYRLRKHLAETPVVSTINHGSDPDWVEAILFAWLARERLAERPQNTPPITGAREPVLLGRIYARG